MPVVRIVRTQPRAGGDEFPALTSRGYELVDRRVAGQKNKVENATFVRSLDEAAYLIEQGYAIRMTGPGKRPSLISPRGVKIVQI